MTIAIRIDAPEQKDNWKAAALGCLGFLCRLWVAGAFAAMLVTVTCLALTGAAFFMALFVMAARHIS